MSAPANGKATDAIAQRVNATLRKGILAAARSRRMGAVVSKHGMRLGAQRFVAGETFAEAAAVLAGLNERGLYANTTLLGEDVLSAEEARSVTAQYTEILDGIAERGLRVNIALKLTHLGLLLDEQLAYENVARLVDHAASLGNFIRLDMEHSGLVDQTLGIYGRLRADGRESVGTVLQAYLYRTPGDLETLLALEPKPNLRLVKGAYLEPPEVAYPRKADVDEAYVRLVESALAGGAYTAVATHDEAAIEQTIALAERMGIPRDRFEFQMLYGVRSRLQLDLVARGFKVLVATPFGPQWYPYLMRRLAERPANMLFVARNLVRR
ncbi:MAG TPA: proline dehydrogenase family protein [Gaiellales bacterium]|nr:proline dehydrogenase family protein [Gaiellales bacterium]